MSSCALFCLLAFLTKVKKVSILLDQHLGFGTLQWEITELLYTTTVCLFYIWCLKRYWNVCLILVCKDSDLLKDEEKLLIITCLSHTDRWQKKIVSDKSRNNQKVWDCSTFWNNTFDMLRILQNTRLEIIQLLDNVGMWLSKVEEPCQAALALCNAHRSASGDRQTLSQVVTCLLNLKVHLLTTTVGKWLAQVLLKSLRERFTGIRWFHTIWCYISRSLLNRSMCFAGSSITRHSATEEGSTVLCVKPGSLV